MRKPWIIFLVVQACGILALIFTDHSLVGIAANVVGILLLVPGSAALLAVELDIGDAGFLALSVAINAGLFMVARRLLIKA
jgi:hypothetical protein